MFFSFHSHPAPISPMPCRDSHVFGRLSVPFPMQLKTRLFIKLPRTQCIDNQKSLAQKVCNLALLIARNTSVSITRPGKTPYSKHCICQTADPEVVHAQGGIKGISGGDDAGKRSPMGIKECGARQRIQEVPTDDHQEQSADFRICDFTTIGAGRSAAASWQAILMREEKAAACR